MPNKLSDRLREDANNQRIFATSNADLARADRAYARAMLVYDAADELDRLTEVLKWIASEAGVCSHCRAIAAKALETLRS